MSTEFFLTLEPSAQDLKMSAGLGEVERRHQTVDPDRAPVINFQVCAESFHYAAVSPPSYLLRCGWAISRRKIENQIEFVRNAPLPSANANLLSESKTTGANKKRAATLISTQLLFMVGRRHRAPRPL